MDSRALTEVAVGIVFDRQGRVLLAQRPEGKPYAGWWEFPGGKLEVGESVHEALARELHEELGIRIGSSFAWLTREHSYEHARVRLHFRRITQFSGAPESREDQAFGWCDPVSPGVGPLLPASVPLMRLLGLPDRYAVSCAGLLGVDTFLERLRDALSGGFRLVQLREPDMPATQFAQLFPMVRSLCATHDALLIVNSCHGAHYWEQSDGVHLRAADLATTFTQSPTQRPEWVGASCHNGEELRQAAAVGADFAVLSPVKETRSHPGAKALGWENFESLVLVAGLPVYALGGIQPSDDREALSAGAHGIAMMRGAFG